MNLLECVEFFVFAFFGVFFTGEYVNVSENQNVSIFFCIGWTLLFMDRK